MLGPEEGHMFAEKTQYDFSRFTPEGKTKKTLKLLAVYLLALTILIALNNSDFGLLLYQNFQGPVKNIRSVQMAPAVKHRVMSSHRSYQHSLQCFPLYFFVLVVAVYLYNEIPSDFMKY